MSDFDIVRSTLESIRQDVAEVRTGQISAAALAAAAREAASQAAIGVKEVADTTSHIRERVAAIEAKMTPLITVPDRLKEVETKVESAEESKKDWPTRLAALVALVGLFGDWIFRIIRGH
jgi:hypothetical protein